ncbi:hypothetical protein Tco_1424637 [Tanacetum coccineum]
MLDNYYGDDTLEELNAAVIMMTRIQPTNNTSVTSSRSDAEILSEIINEAQDEHSMNYELKKQQALLQKELETFKERVKMLEKQPVKALNYKDAYEELEREIHANKDKINNHIKEKAKLYDECAQQEYETLRIQNETKLSKKAFKERENSYLEEIVDLAEQLRSHDQIVFKMGQSI